MSLIPRQFRAHLRYLPRKTSSSLPHTERRRQRMPCNWSFTSSSGAGSTCACVAARQRRLLASLAETGQQTPIVVVAAEGQTDHFVVIDGYKRITALGQLGRDTVEAVVWPMSEAAAVLLDR